MPAIESAEEYLTAEQLASILQTSVYSVHRWMREGWLPPPLRLGRAGRWVRWRRDVIEKFLHEQEAHHAAR
jgi:predicted DNA-binding transcriptional regulator AlpA